METIIEIARLVVKTNIVPTDRILARMLIESKNDILIDVFKAIENKNIESKIVEFETVLTIEEHKILEHGVLIADANSRIEEKVGCILVDEVVDTSIDVLI